jgi:hypothetical protein
MSQTEVLPVEEPGAISESETGSEKEKKEKGPDTREYLVFQEGNSGNWAELGEAVASNADAAIKAMSPKEGVRYAAVPVRNWSVAKPKVKVETTVSLEFE